ncbi:hypothetical protein FNV43_RR05957 [Rhamnella rubrinervis]|uniref:Uncharacterized protein n=1 Tax=Rhamnella rubrinervis TaxID=2594499 RepID=A0A8K0HDN3_9ROSA|nr:hypothetical protein FNV43_RR05957 [Rhamnella rubrinervis]
MKPTTTYTARHTISRYGEEEEEVGAENIESERRRKRDREAARIAVVGIERSADFDVNLEGEKELVSLCSCSSYYVLRGNPLRRLGLFLKREYNDDQDEETIFAGDGLFVQRRNPTLTWVDLKVYIEFDVSSNIVVCKIRQIRPLDLEDLVGSEGSSGSSRSDCGIWRIWWILRSDQDMVDPLDPTVEADGSTRSSISHDPTVEVVYPPNPSNPMIESGGSTRFSRSYNRI